METAAAILTKLAFEQNKDFRDKLSSAAGDKSNLAALIMPLFRQILSELQEQRQADDAFPGPSPK
jgi:hypothetical protein